VDADDSVVSEDNDVADADVSTHQSLKAFWASTHLAAVFGRSASVLVSCIDVGQSISNQLVVIHQSP
jgi:hypothetical protein